MKVKNISGGLLEVPFLDRTIADGETADVPDTQPDGSPLTWSAAHFEVVPDKPAKTEKAAS